MPTSDDLMGFGLNPELAIDLGNQPSQCACLGTGQTTAALILTQNVELLPSASNTGAVLNGNAKVGSPYYIFNSQSTSAIVYAPVGDTFNGTSNGSLTLAQNKAMIAFQYKTSAANPSIGSWWTILTA